MQRNVYIEGEMGELFGSHMFVNAPRVSDALRLIDANNDGFKKYLIDCHEKGVQFAVEVAGEELEYTEELLLPLQQGDIIITPVPEGSGSGFKKLLTGIAILVGTYFLFGEAIALMMAGEGMTLGAFAGMVGFSVGMSLAMAGLGEMMAQDPSTDSDQEQSYLFNGNEQNIIEGDPVPVLYGHLRVPGQPINFELSNFKASGSKHNPFQMGRRGDVQREQDIEDALDALPFSF
ncbi:MAG: hypothetical protein CMD57_04115 [Gammaproteobacteria bacterium]|nr:hypothetical protein [Gammaproteobacteria bacterium]|tara:strand:- start:1000 stop:1698 length:699 start_codon:yes stop_codon:yes gene_type:complete